MTDQHYDLRLAIICYLNDDSLIIPPFYHNHIVDAYGRSTVTWNIYDAAALTLFSAYYDGLLSLTDLTVSGRVAMEWAEQHIDELGLECTGPQMAKAQLIHFEEKRHG